jgi:hypothetical protein
LRITELSTPYVNAQKIFNSLKIKYPSLDAKLIITSGYGHSELTTDGFALIDKAASIFTNSPERKQVLILYDTYQSLLRRNEELKSPDIKDLITIIHQKIKNLLNEIEIVETTQINIQFKELDYDLISKLQEDPLIDKVLTPRTRASIKIVIGTLSSLRKLRIE